MVLMNTVFFYLFFFVSFSFSETVDVQFEKEKAPFRDQKDIARLEICPGSCLEQYPQIQLFLRHYATRIAGLQVMFSSDIPKLHFYNEKEELIETYDDLSMFTSEGLKELLIEGGCYVLPPRNREAATEEELLSEYLRDHKYPNVKNVMKNVERGLKNFYLGKMHIEHKNFAKAIERLEQAIDEGYNTAILTLSDLYFFSDKYGYLEETIEEKQKKAYKLLLKGEELKLPSVYGNLGYMFLKGNGVEERNLERSLEYFKKGEEVNDLESILALGMIHHLGEIVERDQKAALKYYKKAKSLMTIPTRKSTINKLMQHLLGKEDSLQEEERKRIDQILSVVRIQKEE